MQQVIINVGASGAGKTNWSIDYIKRNPNTARINRDDIRRMLVGTIEGFYERKNLNQLEVMISDLEEHLFLKLLTNGFDVIIDNTHLKPSYIDKWVQFIKFWNELGKTHQAEVKFKIFVMNDPKSLKDRVMQRDPFNTEDSVKYIDKQVLSLKNAISHVEKNYKTQIIS